MWEVFFHSLDNSPLGVTPKTEVIFNQEFCDAEKWCKERRLFIAKNEFLTIKIDCISVVFDTATAEEVIRRVLECQSIISICSLKGYSTSSIKASMKRKVRWFL